MNARTSLIDKAGIAFTTYEGIPVNTGWWAFGAVGFAKQMNVSDRLERNVGFTAYSRISLQTMHSDETPNAQTPIRASILRATGIYL